MPAARKPWRKRTHRQRRCAPLVLDSLEERWLPSVSALGDLIGEPTPDSDVREVDVLLTPKPDEAAAASGRDPAELKAAADRPVGPPTPPPAWIIDHIAFDAIGAGRSWPEVYRFELDQPHDTMQTAQVLGGPRTVMIGGLVRPGDSPDVYRVPGTASAYQVTIVESSVNGDLVPTVWLRDDTGQIVGQWTFPSDADQMTIQIRATNLESGHDFYLGVSTTPSENADPAALTANMSSSYALMVTPVSTDSAAVPSNPSGKANVTMSSFTLIATTGLGLGQAGMTGVSTLPEMVATSALAASGSRDDTPASLATSPPQTVATPTSVVAPGPLPVRIAGPFTGIFHPGDPTPELARHDGTRLRSGPSKAANSPVDPEEPAVEIVQPDVIALDGPGGFPLLTATTQAFTLPPVAAACSTSVEETSEPAWAEAFAMLTEATVTAAPVAAEHPSEPAASRAPRSWTYQVGMTVFTAFAMSLVLPDLLPVRPEPRTRFRLPAWLRRWLPGSSGGNGRGRF